MNSSKNTLYPVFLKLEKLNVLIIGGGNAASEKLRYMLKSSPEALITVVAENVSDEIIELLSKHQQVKVYHKKFEAEELTGKNIVIIATNDHDFNKATRDEVKKRGILVNVSDTPELCDFYLGSIVTKGDLKIAISTNGKSPTFAKRFREMLEETLPDNVSDLLENLHLFRQKLNGDFKSKVTRMNEVLGKL